LDAKTYLEKNRAAWNQVMPLHQAAQESIVGTLLAAGQLLLNPALQRELDRIGVGGKNVFQPCCNNGRKLLSVKKMGAKRCVGFDISEAFISVAAALSAASRLPAEFVCSDIYSIPDSGGQAQSATSKKRCHPELVEGSQTSCVASEMTLSRNT